MVLGVDHVCPAGACLTKLFAFVAVGMPLILLAAAELAFCVCMLAILCCRHMSISVTASAGMSLAKMFAVIAVGMPLTLLTTAQVAFLIRKYVQTEMQNMPAADSLPPFGKMHFITWGKQRLGDSHFIARSKQPSALCMTSCMSMCACTTGTDSHSCTLCLIGSPKLRQTTLVLHLSVHLYVHLYVHLTKPETVLTCKSACV